MDTLSVDPGVEEIFYGKWLLFEELQENAFILQVTRGKQENYCQKRYLKWGLDIGMPVNKKRKKSSNKKKALPAANKLSEVLWEFVRPLLERMSPMAMSTKMTRKLIVFAILVWNLSFLPIEDREAHKSELLKSLSIEDNEQSDDDFHEIFNYLLLRKNIHFKNDKRFIVNYQIEERGDNLHLTVAHQHLNK